VKIVLPVVHRVLRRTQPSRPSAEPNSQAAAGTGKTWKVIIRAVDLAVFRQSQHPCGWHPQSVILTVIPDDEILFAR